MDTVYKGCVVWLGQPTDDEIRVLKRAGWRAQVAGLKAGVVLPLDEAVVLLADLRHSDIAAPGLMGQLMDRHADLPWVTLLTPATPARSPQVRRLLEGSCDFFGVPLDMSRLLEALQRISEQPRFAHNITHDMPEIVGCSDAMSMAAERIQEHALAGLPVLITGENGTGKKMAAGMLHRLSARHAAPLVTIQATALLASLMTSEGLDDAAGASAAGTTRPIGTIESLAGGTICLDGVEHLSARAQASLLRLLQGRMVAHVGGESVRIDVQVLAVSRGDLAQAVATGCFREDLYRQLASQHLHMPALRERGGDVELLAQYFLDRFRERHNSRARGFNSMARRAMRRFAWPGNVRELLARVRRAAMVAEDALISVADLGLPASVSHLNDQQGHRLYALRVSAEREAVIACLRESAFSVGECARRLGISHVTVYRLCKKHQLTLSALR